ncbi:biopolymer transporter ExbD [Ramlibacter sp. G-1-2-2]|uniref:Biopolymer transporter ExbD n=1 Tax=Ramlibacter agri TaxID=2728837 RepID=A0A848GV21_9BURK|nr:biopolymer transporter ExbD [Ramlibacter agri]NML42204.1 biopolymer transporter ExbD [Ramlibacter agri]
MAIRYSGQDSEDGLIAEINTTPLVDVMLVLLIIFLITVPVFNSAVSVDLPREPNQAKNPQIENVIITVDAQGAIYWFDTKLPDASGLPELFGKIAQMQPQPELHIRGDVRADYAPIGQVVQAAQQAGIARIGFLTEPPGR